MRRDYANGGTKHRHTMSNKLDVRLLLPGSTVSIAQMSLTAGGADVTDSSDYLG